MVICKITFLFLSEINIKQFNNLRNVDFKQVLK